MDKRIDQSVLNELLEYHPETGKLFWRPRSEQYFKDGAHSASHSCRKWNSRYAGKEAFAALTSEGYRQGSVFDVKLHAHRVIWLMAVGQEPEQVDHINGDRSDNRLANLRPVSHQENGRNQSLHRTNSSGRCGVTRDKKWGKWMAFIRVNGKAVNLGRFKEFEDAVAAREAAERAHGFHANHGKALKGKQP